MAQESDLTGIVERLDRLEALLTRLVTAVEGGKPVAAAAKPAPAASKPAPAPKPAAPKPAPVAAKPAPKPAPVTAAGRPTRPAAVEVREPAKAQKTSESTPTEKPESLLDEAQRKALRIKELDINQFLPPADAPPRDILSAIFRFAFEDAEVGNPLMIGLMHSEIVSAPRSAEHLRSFNFPKLRRGLDKYLDGTDPDSCIIVRADEDEARQSVKVFVHRMGGGMPAPVRMKRDPKADDAWRIIQLSL